MTDFETVRGTLEQHYAAAGANAGSTRDAIEALSRIERCHAALLEALEGFVCSCHNHGRYCWVHTDDPNYRRDLASLNPRMAERFDAAVAAIAQAKPN